MARGRNAAALALAGAVASTTPAHSTPAPSCSRTYTLEMFKRAARAVYAGTGLPPRGSYAHLHRYVRCQRHPENRGAARRYWRGQHDAWAARRHPPMLTELASWYQDGGQTASGYHARYGVANKRLAFGTRLLLRYHGHQVLVTVDDRGPYAGGRVWDLNQNVARAIGFSGVDYVQVTVSGA